MTIQIRSALFIPNNCDFPSSDFFGVVASMDWLLVAKDVELPKPRQGQQPSNSFQFWNCWIRHTRGNRCGRWLCGCRGNGAYRRYNSTYRWHILCRRQWGRRGVLAYEIQHLLLDFRPRATNFFVAKNLVDNAPGVKMNRGGPSYLKLWCYVVPKWVLDIFVVGYHNICKDHRRVGEFGAPMQCLEFLFEHSASRANRTREL